LVGRWERKACQEETEGIGKAKRTIEKRKLPDSKFSSIGGVKGVKRNPRGSLAGRCGQGVGRESAWGKRFVGADMGENRGFPKLGEGSGKYRD